MTHTLAASTNEMTVYKSPTCQCCGRWTAKMKKEGFTIKTIMTNDIYAIKKKVGVTPKMASCHTAIINGYIVEGHVNASAIKKMLKEKPNIIGLTVPGMVIGSPGMEQGNMKQSYNIMAINKDNTLSIYEKH